MPIVKFARTVKTDADREALARKKLAPGIIKQRAIGLQRVADRLSLGVLTLETHCFHKEIQTQQRRLPALPGELNFGRVLRRDVAGDVGPQRFVRHAESGVRRMELLLLEIEAVIAIEIAV